MRSSRRVVITGLGVVAPNGIGKDAFWANLLAGVSGIDGITAFDAERFPCKVAGQVRDFFISDFASRRRAQDMWRFNQFAVAATRMAIDDARLQVERQDTTRIAISFGTCVNGFERIEESYLTLQTHGFDQLHPLTCLEYSTHAPTSHISIEFGIRGPCMTLASACATGIDVIKWGFDRIRAGDVDIAIVGGTEAPLTPLAFATWCATQSLSREINNPSQACRPYDLRRDGLVLAEGSGAIILESLESAVCRGASVYSEVLGFGMGSEATHLRKVDVTGGALARALRQALLAGQLDPSEIDLISAHGNAMPDYDLAETNAFKSVFGKHAYSFPITATKSMTGHPLAASGTLQTIAAALSITHGVVPPTINYEFPDPNCDLDYVPNRCRPARVRRALANAHSMGGTHSVIALGRHSSGP